MTATANPSLTEEQASNGDESNQLAYGLVGEVVSRTLGVPISANTASSWRLRGVSGQKLKTKLIGGRHFCRPLDVLEFQAAVETARAAG